MNIQSILLLLQIMVMILPVKTLAQVKVCDIKYGEKGLDKVNNLQKVKRVFNNKNYESCHQRGS